MTVRKMQLFQEVMLARSSDNKGRFYILNINIKISLLQELRRQGAAKEKALSFVAIGSISVASGTQRLQY